MEINWIQPDTLSERFTPGYYQQAFIENEQRRDRLPCQTLDQLRAQGRIITNGIRGPELDATNYRMLRIQDLQLVFYCSDRALRVSESQYRANKRAWCFPGDILVSIGGELRLAGKVIDSHPQTMGQHTGLIPIDSSKVDGDYVLSYLSSETGKLDLTRYFVGSAQLSIDLEDLREVKVPIPERSIQHAIGNKVRKAEHLREIAEARWQAATQLLSQQLAISLDIAHFESFSPAEVVDAEYRCVSVSPPVAWATPADELGAQYFHPRRVRTRRLISKRASWARLDAVATPQARSQANASLALSRLIGLDQIDSRTGVISESSAGNAEHDGAKVVFRSGSILFSRLRPYLNKVAIWPEQWLAGSGSGELLVYEPNEGVNPHYLFFVLKSPLGLYQVIDVTAGSTHPRVDDDVVDGIAIPRLDSSVEEEIGDHVKAAHSSWYAAAALIPQAKADVEALVAGTLDEAALLVEGEEIERWLRKHPSPNVRRRAT